CIRRGAALRLGKPRSQNHRNDRRHIHGRVAVPGANPPARTPDWGAGAPLSRASLDTPRGHDEQDPAQTSRMPRVDDRQGPGATAEMPRIDDRQGPSATGQFPRPNVQPQQPGQFGQQGGADPFVRSDVFGTPAPGQQDPQSTGQFAAPQAYGNGNGYDGGYDGSSTGRHALPGSPGQGPADTGRFERPQPGGRADFGAPRPQAPQAPQAPQQRPVRQEPDNRGAAQRPDPGRGPGDGWALPPASGPGDGRTPLYDTLETNWFHGGQQGGQQEQSAPAQAPQQQAPAGPHQSSTTSSWRTSPNDELVRQAERVRQPAAGGITTSGLPRRVPRANLVPGTAQQQQHQSGPQVSRAPDDVRGRLTNLRRGIAQGRQAGGGQTGSFPSPTHQQER
ncbi:hypothetical protein ACWDFL_28620, partial [Streptomyces bungoensis]